MIGSRRTARLTASGLAALIGLGGAFLTPGSPAAASPTGAVFSVAGSVTFSPSMAPTGAGTATLVLTLTNDGTSGPASGTLIASGPVTNGCALASGAAGGSISWSDGTTSGVGFQTQAAGPAEYLTGLVNFSSNAFGGDYLNGALALAADGVVACASGSTTTVAVSGQMSLASPQT